MESVAQWSFVQLDDHSLLQVTECGNFGVIRVSESCKPANHVYMVDFQATEREGISSGRTAQLSC